MASLHEEPDAFSNRHDGAEIKLVDERDKPNEHLITSIAMRRTHSSNDKKWYNGYKKEGWIGARAHVFLSQY